MDDVTRAQVQSELEALRAQMKAGDAPHPPELIEQVDALHQLVSGEREESFPSKTARRLEQRLLAWEAEHPQVVALAARVARALEDAGL